MRLGKAWPPRRRKTPCLRGAGCQPLRPGTVGNCWGAWPAPVPRCALASQVCPLMKRGTGVPGCARPTSTHLCVPMPEPLSTREKPLRVTACPAGLTPGCDAGRRVWGSDLSSLDEGLHVRFAHWAVSQSGRAPSGLKGSLLFRAFFLAPGRPRPLGHLGTVVEGCETNWAGAGGWGSTQGSGISLWVGMGGTDMSPGGTPRSNPATEMPVLFRWRVGPGREL